MPILVAESLQKHYVSGESNVTALAGVSFVVDKGDFVALMGPSGCGKSTLLHLCGAMDRASSGSIVLNGRDLAKLGDDDLTHVRREQVGFVFQFFNLLPTLTIADNIALPCLLAGMKGDQADARAKALAERVGIAHRLSHFPQQVSGGEMQRAAIARALVHQPALLVADEPTGNLDSDNGAKVLALLSELNQEMGVTVLLATHNVDVAAAATRWSWTACSPPMAPAACDSVRWSRWAQTMSPRSSPPLRGASRSYWPAVAARMVAKGSTRPIGTPKRRRPWRVSRPRPCAASRPLAPARACRCADGAMPSTCRARRHSAGGMRASMGSISTRALSYRRVLASAWDGCAGMPCVRRSGRIGSN